MDYEEQAGLLFAHLGEACKLTLATSAEDRVTARTVSCIVQNGCFYFQTDQNMLKYRQLRKNPLVALCAGDVQLEGIASPAGRPLDCPAFAIPFARHFPHAFSLYSALPEEVLVRVRPILVTWWCYDGEGRPFRLILHPQERLARREYYSPRQEDDLS